MLLLFLLSLSLLLLLLLLFFFFIRDTRAKLDIPNSPQSPYIWKNSEGSISDFSISAQSFIKGNCHKSRISDDMDMNLIPVIKLDKRNKTMSKNLTMTQWWKLWRHCHFFNLQQFGDSGRIICKTYIFNNSNLLSYKNRKQH